MRKDIPPPPDILRPSIDGVITQERTYKLITPLFGGGVTPGEVDLLTPIRGTEIRGHLRFWWRATRGGQAKFENNLEKLKAEEDAIWGTASQKGKIGPHFSQIVQITVEAPMPKSEAAIAPFNITPKRKKHANDKNWETKPNRSSGVPAYAAFPLKPSNEELKQETRPVARLVYKDITLKLTISFPEGRRKDIEDALWAWESFGGVGARTRRGFGALQLLTLAEVGEKRELEASAFTTTQATKASLTDHIKIISPYKQFPANVPHISGSTRLEIIGPFTSPEEAWKALIDRLFRFRQPQDKTRSWPETKEVRSIIAENKREHKFPKAVLGLPIVFNLDNTANNPTLQGKEKQKERLASPLILRPLAWGNTWVGVALLLEGNELHPSGLVLTKGNQPYDAPIRTQLRANQAINEATNIEPLKGNTNVLQKLMDAFRDYAPRHFTTQNHGGRNRR